VNQFNSFPSVYMPNMRRNASLKVRSMAEEEQKEQLKVPVDPITPTPVTPTPQPAYTRSPKVRIVVKIISTCFPELYAR
ncbi:early light-induced-like protein, partial [Trifolium pratense]